MKVFESEYIDIELPPSVERAWIVSQATKKPLVIVTGDRLFYHFRDNEDNETEPARFVIQPCPCGFFGDSAKKCSCTVKQIEKHQQEIQNSYQDCIWIEGHISNRAITFKKLDTTCQQLLKSACRELQMTTAQIVTVIETAEAIAGLENGVIKPEHVAEAMSYRTK